MRKTWKKVFVNLKKSHQYLWTSRKSQFHVYNQRLPNAQLHFRNGGK